MQTGDLGAELRRHLAALDDARELALAGFAGVEAVLRNAVEHCDGTVNEITKLVFLLRVCEQKHERVRDHRGPTLQGLAEETILWKRG